MHRLSLRYLAFTLLLTLQLLAQRDLGTLVGTVTDPQGGAVPNAKVTLTEDATGLSYTVQTSEGGEYIRTALKPGTYTVTVEVTGFQKAFQRNVILTAGDRAAVNITLTVGEVSQTVEITASAPLLQTESTIVGANINSRNVSELPLGGTRQFTYLARLSPGVVPAEPGARDAAGGGFSANGVRSNGQNNFLLNGVDNNVNVIDFLNQTAYVVGPSPDAIGEMRVLTNGYNAEYGRGAGGVINVTIKSGTNQFHGTLFEFLQNEKLNANRWENNRQGTRRGPLKQNQFGGSIGGPIIRNKTFWFADYQGTRIRSTGGTVPGLGVSFQGTIPSPEFLNGDFSRLLTGRQIGVDANGRPVLEGQIYDPLTTETTGRFFPNGQPEQVRLPFEGNRIPVSRFDPAARRIAALFPAPNALTAATGLAQNNFFVITSGQQQIDQADARIDHQFTDRDSIFGSISWSNLSKVNTPPLPGALDATYFNAAAEETLARNAMLSYTRVWTPAVLTETRVAFTRLVTSRTQANPDVDQFTAFGIGGYNPTTALNGGLPSINIDRYNGIGASDWLPSLEYNNVWDFIQNVSINKGSHALKFGAEYRPIKFPFFQVPTPHGNLFFSRNETAAPRTVADQSFTPNTGDGFAAFLLGRVTEGRISTNNFISSEKQAWAFFAQDDFKVTSRLTLNLGVRYELFSPISERFGRQSNFDFATQTLYIPKGKDQDLPLPPNFATAFPQVKVSRGEVDKYLIPWDKTNFAPRIGIAYNLFSRTVLRAGYGMFYGGEENQGGNPNRGESVPFNQSTNLARQDITDFDVNPFFRSGFSAGFPSNVFSLPAPIVLRGVARNFRNPLVHKWNFAVQQDLGGNTALEMSYIGNHQARQLLNWDPNGINISSDPSIPRNQLRPYPNLGEVIESATFGYGNYHALATKLEKRYSNGLDFLAAYTYGHALSNVGTTLSGSSNFGSRDPRNISSAYASAAWDIRHNLTTSFLYDLPFGRGRRFGGDLNRVTDALLGGWQVNGIVSLRTGPPFSLGTNQCVGQFGTCGPDLVPGRDPKNEPEGGRTPERWFDTSAVTAPRPGTFGTIGLQSNNAPPTRNLDLSLFKAFRFTERYSLQFRTESFNLTNTPQFGQPVATQGDPQFGRINGTQTGSERRVQFALRFLF